MKTDLQRAAQELVTNLTSITQAAQNEEQLKHEAENALEAACERLEITWTPFQLERTLRGAIPKKLRFADVVHGAVIVEYEPPGSFHGKDGRRVAHARSQAEEYTNLLQVEEGRPLTEYVLVSWDGSHITFGRNAGSSYHWGPLQAFDHSAASQLLGHLRDDGVPLVHPLLLRSRVGPASEVGSALLPLLFQAVQVADSAEGITKTKLLFTEWRRLFGQVVGDPSARLKLHLEEIGEAQGEDYAADPAAYLFSLNTYIAAVAKLVAALALPNASEDVSDPNVHIAERMRQLESGRLFLDAGISNMLNSDFFSWYADDPAWDTYEAPVENLVNTLRGISFDVTRKEAESTRDLFKGLYMTFAPSALRHALGEYYTPDWLASHVLTTIQWDQGQSLLDPTCGSGTFLLEALKRRLESATDETTGSDLLTGLYGFDLNPLAVLAARASLVVFIGHRLDPANPIQVPIYLADSINPATDSAGTYEHSIQTERGIKVFRMPAPVVESSEYFGLMQALRDLVDGEQGRPEIEDALSEEPLIADLTSQEREVLGESVDLLLDLHESDWNGIWSSILADRFAAGAVPAVSAVVGNPPWVKWSHLPAEYAEFIKPLCMALGVFSDDHWVGGIESDISTVITYRALQRFCAPGGVLAFLITGTVFATESSQGFRRWTLKSADGKPEPVQVEAVEDFGAVAPFEGVHNHPTLLILRRNGEETAYPVPYRVWSLEGRSRASGAAIVSTAEFESAARLDDLLARPIPGSDAGPWLKGTKDQHEIWGHLFDAEASPAFRARKGITTDANGIYFVEVSPSPQDHMVAVRNDPKNGKRAVPRRSATIEDDHVFPLLRGKGVHPFRAEPDPTYCVIVPQRGMHGDPALQQSAAKTHAFLRRFESTLVSRASYKLYQANQVFWSVWSTGPYTFAPFKVVWKEMSGGRFCAAYVGMHEHSGLGPKVVVPDHKVYFVPCESEDEAAYLTGLLNAPTIAGGVNAYAAALSLGVSVVQYLRLPAFDQADPGHQEVVALSRELSESEDDPSDEQWSRLDRIAGLVVRPQDIIL